MVFEDFNQNITVKTLFLEQKNIKNEYSVETSTLVSAQIVSKKEKAVSSSDFNMATDSNNNAGAKAVPNLNPGEMVNSVNEAVVSDPANPNTMQSNLEVAVDDNAHVKPESKPSSEMGNSDTTTLASDSTHPKTVQHNQILLTAVYTRSIKQTTVIYGLTNANRIDAISPCLSPCSLGATEQMQCRMPQPQMQRYDVPQMSNVYNQGGYIPHQNHSPTADGRLGRYRIPPYICHGQQVTPNGLSIPPRPPHIAQLPPHVNMQWKPREPCQRAQLPPHYNMPWRPPFQWRGPHVPRLDNGQSIAPSPCHATQHPPHGNGQSISPHLLFHATQRPPHGNGQSIPPHLFHATQHPPNVNKQWKPTPSLHGQPVPPHVNGQGVSAPLVYGPLIPPYVDGQNIPLPPYHGPQWPPCSNNQHVPPLAYQVPQSPVDPLGQFIPSCCSPGPHLLTDPYGMPIGCPNCQHDPSVYGQSIPPYYFVPKFSTCPYVTAFPGQDQFKPVPWGHYMPPTPNYLVPYPPGTQGKAKKSKAIKITRPSSSLNEKLPPSIIPKINIQGQPAQDIGEQDMSPNLDTQLSTDPDKNLLVNIEEKDVSVDPKENLLEDIGEMTSTNLDEQQSLDHGDKQLEDLNEAPIKEEINFVENLPLDDEQLQIATILDEHELINLDTKLSTDIDEIRALDVSTEQTDFDGDLSPSHGEKSPDLDKESARLSDFLPLCVREQLLSNQSPTPEQMGEVEASPVIEQLDANVEPPPGFEKNPPLYVDLDKTYKRQDERPSGQLPLYLR